MQDKTINNALLALRKQIIRGNLEGLDHVNALLVARGIDPSTHKVGHARPANSCRQGEVRMIIMEALGSGPKRPCEIGAHFMACKPEIAPDRAMIRVYRAIYKLRDKGLVKHEGRLWSKVLLNESLNALKKLIESDAPLWQKQGGPPGKKSHPEA